MCLRSIKFTAFSEEEKKKKEMNTFPSTEHIEDLGTKTRNHLMNTIQSVNAYAELFYSSRYY